MYQYLSFFFLTCSFLSLWVRKDPKIWGVFLGCSLFVGLVSGNVLWLGMTFLSGLFVLWMFYKKTNNVFVFLIITIFTVCFKINIVPGFCPFLITSQFRLGLDQAIVGLFPLAFVVPLSQSVADWKRVLKGCLVGCAGIGLLAVLATITDTTHWDFKLPTFMLLRTWSNVILTSIPEEGFFRGFLQNGLSQYFRNTAIGKTAALVITSLVFTFTHIFWSPSVSVLGFVFLAGLLYGSVYLISERIESAIFCHALLNFIHMTFFSYHAM